MKKIYLAFLVFSLAATQGSYGQYTFNFSLGPGVSFNKMDPTQLDTFSASWNRYYKVNMKQDYAMWSSRTTAPGFDIAFDFYNPSKVSFHMLFSVGAYWGKQVNKSILWNNYVHELDLRFNDVPVFFGLGPQFKGFLFIDYLFGADFRSTSLRSTVTYPDGSRSMGYEMDILGYYESTAPTFAHGVAVSIKIWRLMLSARWTFPLKTALNSETHLMDFDVNRYRQSEFPVNFETFSSQNLVYDEANMLNETPLNKSTLNFSLKFVIGRIK